MKTLGQLLLEASQASQQAKQMGLTYSGFGRYKDKSGKVTHKSQGGKLVKVTAQKPSVQKPTAAKSTAPPGIMKQKPPATPTVSNEPKPEMKFGDISKVVAYNDWGEKAKAAFNDAVNKYTSGPAPVKVWTSEDENGDFDTFEKFAQGVRQGKKLGTVETVMSDDEDESAASYDVYEKDGNVYMTSFDNGFEDVMQIGKSKKDSASSDQGA